MFPTGLTVQTMASTQGVSNGSPPPVPGPTSDLTDDSSNVLTDDSGNTLEDAE